MTFIKGQPSMFKGRKHSEETKKRMRLVHKRNPNSGIFKKGCFSWNKGVTGEASHSYGITFSDERKKKISEAKKKYKFTEKHLLNMSLCQRRDKHPNWKGGITELRQQIMDSSKYRKWKKEVLMRDKNRCVKCWSNDGQLDADHYPNSFSYLLNFYNIKSLEEALNCKELWEIDNGRTLCLSCHKETINYGGVKFDNISLKD